MNNNDLIVYYYYHDCWSPFPNNVGDTLAHKIWWIAGWGFRYRIPLPVIQKEQNQ